MNIYQKICRLDKIFPGQLTSFGNKDREEMRKALFKKNNLQITQTFLHNIHKKYTHYTYSMVRNLLGPFSTTCR